MSAADIFRLEKKLKQLSLTRLEADSKYVITKKSDQLRYRFIPSRLVPGIKKTKPYEIGLLHFEPYPNWCIHVTLDEVLKIFPLEDCIYKEVKDGEPWES